VDNWTDWKNQGTYTPFLAIFSEIFSLRLFEKRTLSTSPYPVSSLLHAAIISCHRNFHLLEAHQFTHKRRLCTLDGLGLARGLVLCDMTQLAVGPGKLDCLTELSLEPIYEANSHT
jgi:hypothetical protein